METGKRRSVTQKIWRDERNGCADRSQLSLFLSFPLERIYLVRLLMCVRYLLVARGDDDLMNEKKEKMNWGKGGKGAELVRVDDEDRNGNDF